MRPSIRNATAAIICSTRSGFGAGAMPALLIMMSSRPWRATALSTSASNAAESVTSNTTGSPPTSAAVAAAASGERSLTTISAPSAASRRANAAPRPEPAPVMNATWPSRTRPADVDGAWSCTAVDRRCRVR